MAKVKYIKDKLLYEGKAKKIYSIEGQQFRNQVIMYFKDDATAFNAEKKSEFAGKGELNCWISDVLLRAMEHLGIPTHYKEKISGREIVADHVKIVPIEVIVRNVAAGTFCKRYGLENGTKLHSSIVEYCVKDDDLGDPPIAWEAITALNPGVEDDLVEMTQMTEDVNKYLRAIFYTLGLVLVDFKLEFGRNSHGDVVLADEICPDTMRLWDINTMQSFDKDLFRFDKGDLLAGYKEVQRRLEAWQDGIGK
jgi:phosphoribosylaminoimidazole-succinocarboxamide synthase